MTAAAKPAGDYLPRLVVVYDDGAASFSEIFRFGAPVARLTFVVAQRLSSSPMMSAFRELADIVLYTDVGEVCQHLLGTGKPHGITTFSERMIRLTGALADRLGLRYHNPETVLRLTDKALQRQALCDSGVDSLRTAAIPPGTDIGPAVRTVNLPAVLKPVQSEGSRATFCLTDAECADSILRQARAAVGPDAWLQLEEMLIGRDTWPFGDYVSVESMTVGDNIHHLTITGKYRLVAPFREVGQFWPASLRPGESREITKLTSAALQALGVRSGVTHTELKLTPAGPRIIEVNGRLGGFVDDLARRSMGASLITLECAAAAGADIDVTPYRMAEDVVFNFSNLPPLEATKLLRVDRSGGLWSDYGLNYRTLIRPGSPLTGVSTQELDLISGRARNYGEMFETLRRAVSSLRFRFHTSDDGDRLLVGSLLPSADSLVDGSPWPSEKEPTPQRLI